MRFASSPIALVLALAGCSGADGGASTDAPSTPTSTAPSDPGLDAGAPRTADGSADGATTPGPTANGYSADLCGNGVDDDGNGLIDDACPVTACTMKLSEPIATGRFDGLTFLKGAGDFVAFGRVSTWSTPAMQRFVGGTSSGAPAPLDVQFSQVDAFLGGPILLGRAASPGLLKSRKLDPATLADVGDWSIIPSATVPAATWSPALFEGVSYGAVNGSIWVAAHLKGQPKLRIGRFDAGLALQASYEIDVFGRYDVVSLGGMPYVYDRLRNGGATSYEAFTRVVGLGDTAPRFATEVFDDAWSDFNAWSSDHAVAAQAVDKVLLCRGGPREHAFSAHVFAHEVDCHVVSARTGATLGGFTLTDYAVSEVDSELLAAPNGADFLLARANIIGSLATLHIDRLTASGVLTKDIVAPVPIASTYIERLVETGPNQYAIVYRDMSPGPIFIRTLGCAP